MALYGGPRPPNEVFYSSLRPPTCVVLFVLRALSSFSSVCARRTSRFGKYHQSVSQRVLPEVLFVRKGTVRLESISRKN